MKNYDRIFVIVLDSLGIGAMPDSAKFGDIGDVYKRQTLCFQGIERYLIIKYNSY